MRQNFTKNLFVGMISDQSSGAEVPQHLGCSVDYADGTLKMGLKVTKTDGTTENVAASYLDDNKDKIAFAAGWEPFYVRRLKSLLDSVNPDQKIKFQSEAGVPCTELQAEEAFSLPSGREKTTPKPKAIGYAYPSSVVAKMFDRASSGCFIAQVDDMIVGEPFDSIEQAEAVADERWPSLPYASHYLQNPLPGSKFCASQPSMK